MMIDEYGELPRISMLVRAHTLSKWQVDRRLQSMVYSKHARACRTAYSSITAARLIALSIIKKDL